MQQQHCQHHHSQYRAVKRQQGFRKYHFQALDIRRIFKNAGVHRKVFD